MRPPASKPDQTLSHEEQLYLETLREHGRVIEASSEDAPLPPGVTHVLVNGKAGQPARLVERRKSAF